MYSLFNRILFAFLLLSGYSAYSQILDPIKWTFSQKQISDSEFTITAHADIPKGWHIYSQYSDSNGATPMAFTYTPSPDYKLEGKTVEDTCITKYDSTFKCIVKYFIKPANFTQKIVVHNMKGFTIKGNVFFQSCNESMCLPPKTVDFDVPIPAPVSMPKSEGSSIWLWLLGFAAGLGAIFTPCVFPMIPLTVSFFLKRADKHKKKLSGAYLYALSIVLIYTLAGLIITLIWGGDALNSIGSNGILNLFFFLIFLILGFSFLGAFELTLPSSWINKSEHASERGGFLGIFFMALTLCLISFSCTGPFLGGILAEAGFSGKHWGLVVGINGFSVALALPFALFALIPNLLNSLPKSGGWLNSIKVVFGLLEVAFSLKFLSTADLKGLHIKWLHLHINGPMGLLKREIFIAIWIVIFLIMGFYLLGKIKFHHDSDLPYLSVTRFMFSLFAFAFAIYLIPGLFGAPLKIIGGLEPPSNYSEGWKLSAGGSSGSLSPPDTANSKGSKINTPVKSVAKSGVMDCPLDLNCYKDYSQALTAAKAANKPIMINFTGIACVNCRKMEENVWSDPAIFKIINDDYVLVSLFVDDETELPDTAKYVSKTTNEKIETFGNKWSDLEASGYQTNTQPLYVLVDYNGNLLTPPRGGYDPDIEQYKQFLEEGKKKFKK